MLDYVYGLNKSGLSVIKLLHKQKKNFDCWDDDKKIRFLVNKQIPKLSSLKEGYPAKELMLQRFFKDMPYLKKYDITCFGKYYVADINGRQECRQH